MAPTNEGPAVASGITLPRRHPAEAGRAEADRDAPLIDHMPVMLDGTDVVSHRAACRRKIRHDPVTDEQRNGRGREAVGIVGDQRGGAPLLVEIGDAGGLIGEPVIDRADAGEEIGKRRPAAF
jgi:hypothetical protein